MSVRNNEERLGAVQSESSPAPSSNLNDPLNFIVPTMHVDLPSEGKYYPIGHPLRDKKSIELRFMTAKDEDILTSPNLIKKGIVLSRLVQSLLLDKTINVDDILLGDKNAILIQARISGYGQWYQANVTCPSCQEVQEEEYDLEECSVLHEGEKDLENVSFLENGNVIITLPKTKAECEVRFFTGHEEKIIFKNLEKKKGPENILSQQMKLAVFAVNGYDNPEVIEHFIENMPISDARTLRQTYDKISPSANLRANFNCQSCDYQEDMEVPLTVDFFWPDR